MIIYKCDLCKKDITLKEINTGIMIDGTRYFILKAQVTKNRVYKKTFDVCDNCYKEIGKVLNNIITRPKKA